MPIALDTVVSVHQAAEIIGCTPGCVRRMLRSGELKGVKLNERAWAVYLDDAKRVAKSPYTLGRPRLGSC